PQFVLGKVADALNDRGKPLKGSKVTLLGVAYKRDVDDCRESPGLELLELLLGKGADACYHDPHVPRLPPTRRHPHLRLDSVELTAEHLAEQDSVVIVTDHSAYDWGWVVRHSPLVVDTRNATRGVAAGGEKVVPA